MRRFWIGLFVIWMIPFCVMAKDDSVRQAKQLFNAGNQLFADDDYEAAAAKFREAYKLKPSYKILYNIGQSEAAAKRFGVALEAFEKYIAEGGDDIPMDRQNEVRSEIKRMREMTGFLEIEGAKGMQIFVDGIPRGTFPITRRIPVAGTVVHQVKAVLDDQVQEEEIRVSGGDSVSLRLLLSDEPVTPDSASAPVAEPEPLHTQDEGEVTPEGDDQKKKGPLVPGIVLAGTGAAGLVAGSICGGLVLTKENMLKSKCDGSVCNMSDKEIVDSRDRLEITSAVLWATGGVLAATGLALILVSKLKKKDKETTLIVPSRGGLTVAGSF